MNKLCLRCGQSASAVYVLSTDCEICRTLEKDVTEYIGMLEKVVFDQPGESVNILSMKRDLRKFYGVRTTDDE